MLVCRFCMTQNDVDIDLFQSALYSKLVCLPVQIADNDILPKRICHQCETKVYNFYSFWRCVQDVEKELLSQIDSDKIILDSDDVMLSPDTQIVSNSVKTSSLSRSTMTLRSSVPNKSSASTINKATSSIQNNNNNNNNNSINDEHQLLASDQDLNSMPTSPNQSNHNFAVDGNYEYYSNYDDEDGGPLMHFMLNNNDIMSTNFQEFDGSSCSVNSSPSPNNKSSKKYKKKNKKHQCNICGKILRSPGLLRLHIDEDHNFVRIKCEICDKRVKKKNFRKHLRIHNRSPKMSYTCKQCNKIFYTTKSLDNHHKTICSVPITENFIMCNICNEEFQSDELFESHLDTCRNDQTIPASTSESSYTILKNLLHSTGDEPNYYCDICQKEFDSEDFLLKHKSIHDNCTCLVCGKVLASKAILKRHMNLHSESECVTCNVCGKQFTRDSNLKAHMKIHLNIRSHACDECGKLFRRKYHLKRHMLTHTGEKPYACQLCDKKYTSKESLRCHERSLHNVYC